MGLRRRADGAASPRFGGVCVLPPVSTLDGVVWRWLTKARGKEPDARLDIADDDWKREAAIQELESVMWRVGVLTATAHELVEDMEVPGSEPSPPPAVLSDARELVKVIDVHERERDLWPSQAWLAAVQLFGVVLGVYAMFFDKLTNVGLLVAALGLLLIRRVLSTPLP
jgi:hypothetical protein